MTDEVFDPVPGMRADLDQALAMLPELCRLLYGYYKNLVEAGFDDVDALAMVTEYATAIMMGHSTE